MSALSKPLLAVFAFPAWILICRTLDRLGKGLRTSARDALLSENATRETKAGVFGFHRAMDTLGAAIWPAIALVFLWLYPGQYKLIFLLAFLPGMISVLLIFLVTERRKPVSTLGKGHFLSFFKYWKVASPTYKRLVVGLLFFGLFNSADVFLILKTKEVTGSDQATITAYVFYNLVFALASYPLGRLADRTGFKKLIVSGLFVFTLVYFLFATAASIPLIFLGFFLYGIYAAATEGVSKAWITNMAHDADTGTAIGFFTSCQSICTLLASIIAGAIWTGAGSSLTFFISATAAFLAAFYFLVWQKER